MAGGRTCCVLSLSLSLALVVALALVWNSCAIPGEYTLREHRAAINELCHKTLKDLYSRRPEARSKIERAPGYAVFRQSGLEAPLPGTGDGYGVAVDNRNGKRTFMRMGEVLVGPGSGSKKFSAVFVFGTKDTFRRFVDSGWQFAEQAEADTLRVYQITDAGVVLRATVHGTRYWKDKSLN
jgi:hypothetical protein